MRLTLCILLLCFWVLVLPGIEVSGYISEDTTWTIVDSPYIVTGFLYIDAGVTLTIMPGVEILVVGAEKNNPDNFDWVGDTEPQAKMIVVYGKIIACGTADLPITFDVHNNDNGYRWGGIHIHNSAPESLFEYCVLKRTYYCCISPGIKIFGALHFDNGLVHSYHNTFVDNHMAIVSYSLKRDAVVYDCKFYSGVNSYPEPYNYVVFIDIDAAYPLPPIRTFKVTIAKCYFTGDAEIGGVDYYTDCLFLNCVFDNVQPYYLPLSQERSARTHYGSLSFYGNTIINGYVSIIAYIRDTNGFAFCRRNTMIKYPQSYTQYEPLMICAGGWGMAHLCDNYMEGAVRFGIVDTGTSNVLIYNNIVKTNNIQGIDVESYSVEHTDAIIRIFNNLIVASNPDTLVFDELLRAMNSNVLFYNNSFSSFSSIGTSYRSNLDFYNNIFHNLQEAPSNGYSAEYPNTYGYNCFNLPLLSSASILDAGGNILADSCFVDAAAGDYTLQEGFAGIDSGLNLPDLPEFDIRYHRRIAGGSEGAVRRVDMGAFEYNSEYLGGIKAFVFDAETGEAVDCVQAVIISKLPEFTDSLGYFVYPTGAGTFRLNLNRWDYEPRIIEGLEVLPGEEIELDIALQKKTMSAPSGEETPAVKEITLKNYPNPFNPETSINYSLPEAGKVLLTIYNLKGQKLICLVDGEQAQGLHSLIWNGKDENGRSLPSGIYLARLVHNGRVISRKMILMK